MRDRTSVAGTVRGYVVNEEAPEVDIELSVWLLYAFVQPLAY